MENTGIVTRQMEGKTWGYQNWEVGRTSWECRLPLEHRRGHWPATPVFLRKHKEASPVSVQGRDNWKLEAPAAAQVQSLCQCDTEESETGRRVSLLPPPSFPLSLAPTMGREGKGAARRMEMRFCCLSPSIQAEQKSAV